MLNSTVKHTIHCFLYGFYVIFCQLCFFLYRPASASDISDQRHVLTIVFSSLQLPILLTLPFILENAMGLLFFNAFEDKVELACGQQLAPFICFRIVTRGDYPKLVKQNVERNRAICSEVGLKHFVVEVVTDKPIGVPQTSQTQEVLVPSSYRTRSGVLYKGRALQYCLEEGVCNLGDNDWIVHLDEETLLTRSAIHGILNFVASGKHHIGQGRITYANENVVNMYLTVNDSIRVADDMGRVQLELRVWHRPIFGWKGSFIVVQAGVERQITFDHGSASSLLEDNYFSTYAAMQGYSFDYVEGEMWEKCPFSIWDYVQQRKRWVQGLSFLAHDKQIPVRYRVSYILSFYATATLPISLVSSAIAMMYHLQGPWLMDAISLFMITTSSYMHIFGVVKSFSIAKIGLPMYLLNLFIGFVALPFDIFTISSAVILAIFCGKQNFYVVDKDDNQRTTIKLTRI